MTRHSQTSSTLADVLARLDGDQWIPEARRKAWSGAIRRFCDVVGQPPERVTGSLAVVDRLLKAIPDAALRHSKKTIANIRSHLKASLLHAQAVKLPPQRGEPLTPAWQQLADALKDPRHRKGLSRLMRFASHQGIAPTEMSDAAFATIVGRVELVNWGRDTERFRRDAAALWNDAARRVPGWPNVQLTVAPTGREVPHLELSDLPATLQADIKAYAEWASGANRFAANAPDRPLKATTLKQRVTLLRIAASIVIRTLGDPAAVPNLKALVQPENVRRVLEHYDRKKARSPAFLVGISITLKAVATHWVKLGREQLDELKRLHRRLDKPGPGLTDKNRALLRQLEDPQMRSKLLALPQSLRLAMDQRSMSASRRLQQIQVALAIEILFSAPIRLRNLVTLRLNHEITWPAGPGGEVYITIDRDESKNGQPLEYQLSVTGRALLDEYRARFRPTVQGDWLFVRPDGSRVPDATLADGIGKAIKRALGIHMTPHQFRHFAAAVVLDKMPGALGVVQDLLGHKHPKVTWNAYSGRRTLQAGREFDRILNMSRQPRTEG